MTRKRMLKFLLWLLSGILFVVVSISVIIWVYKDEIIEVAIDEANKYLKVKVEVSDVDLTFWGTFPNLSIDFNNVFIRDSYEGATENDTLLFTERIRCRFDPMDIWNENYEIHALEIGSGTLQLKVDSAGVTNYDILKPSDEVEGSEAMDFKLNRLQIEDLNFMYLNAATAQSYNTTFAQLAATGDFSHKKFTAKTMGKFHIHSAKSGEIALVQNQPAELSLGILIDIDSGSVTIPASTVYISDLPFNFYGDFDTSAYSFHLNGKGLKLEEVANKLAPEKTQEFRTYSGKGNVEFKFDVSGVSHSLLGPDIACSFGVKDGMLKEPSSGISLRDINVNGVFSRKGEKGSERLDINQFSFASTLGIFSGDLRIRNFLNPIYDANAKGAIDLKVLHQFFGTRFLEKLNGKADMNAKIKVQQFVDENGFSNYDLITASGNVDLSNVTLQAINDKREFHGVSGSLLFRDNELGVKQLKVKFLESDLRLDGHFSNLNGFLNGSSPLIAEASVRSSNIKVSDLSSSEKQDKMVGERSFILPNTVDGTMEMNIGNLEYEGHQFKNCEGRIRVLPRHIKIDRFHFTNAASRISGMVDIHEKRPEIMELSCNLVSNKIEMSEVFKEWNNFDQTVITSENLSGDAQLNLELFVPFDFRNGAITNQIAMTAALRVTNGRLRNVSAFQEIVKSLQSSAAAKLAIGKENIKTFSSKLQDLRFESLENTIAIRNSIITIPSMSVKSSALDLEVSGKHHFNNDIDYRFGFRFRDLKQKKESEFGNIVDDGTGKVVFLRMYGNMSDPNIEWDKETSREERKEKNEQEAEDLKSMLKSEFGLFKNDTTVKSYVQEKRPKEEISIEFDVLESNDSIIKQKTKKDTKLNRALEKWKEEAEGAKKEEFEIDD
jgi:hypothetical protein